jgi:hypothetical protein
MSISGSLFKQMSTVFCWKFSANTESSSETHASASMQTDAEYFLNSSLLMAANCFST